MTTDVPEDAASLIDAPYFDLSNKGALSFTSEIVIWTSTRVSLKGFPPSRASTFRVYDAVVSLSSMDWTLRTPGDK